MTRPVDPSAADDATWTAYLHLRDNPMGRHIERWRHQHGCGRFFECARDPVTGRIAATYRFGEGPPP